jgi:hypothetical protein
MPPGPETGMRLWAHEIPANAKAAMADSFLGPEILGPIDGSRIVLPNDST